MPVSIAQRFAATSFNSVNGQIQSPATSPNRNRIIKATQLLVQQGFAPQPNIKYTTNRLSKEFLHNIGCTLVDVGVGFSIVPPMGDLENKRINKSSMYTNLVSTPTRPGGYVTEQTALAAQNPFFTLDDELPPVDMISLKYMLQDQEKNPGQDLVAIGSCMSQKNMTKNRNLKYFNEVWRYAQRTNF